MLELQKYLHSHGIEKLQSKLSIKVYRHPTEPLVGFKYNQIDSPRVHPVVKECRGIVLEDKTWKLVAKPFDRFFNVGENKEDTENFYWDKFTCVNKVDGSLIIVYHYNGKWHVNTSGSFGLGSPPMYEGSWQDLFWKTSKINTDKLSPDATYIFELCTPYNRVVKDYGKPTVFLLGVRMIHGEMFEVLNALNSLEMPEDVLDITAVGLGVSRGKTYGVNNEDEVRAFLEGLEETKELEEGVVIRDMNGLRMKWKTKRYLALHRLNDNGNILLSKNLMTIELTGEVSETIAYFPIKKALKKVKRGIDLMVEDIHAQWFVFGDLKSQKKFALKVKDHRFSSILFQMRKDLEWVEDECQRKYIRKALLDSVKRSAEIIFGSKMFQFDTIDETEVSV